MSEAFLSTIRRAHAIYPITTVQLEWSRDVEEERIPTCRELGIGIVSYAPLGRGFFASGPKLLELEEGDFRKHCVKCQKSTHQLFHHYKIRQLLAHSKLLKKY